LHPHRVHRVVNSDDAKPIAGEELGGTSAGPDSVVLYMIAADAGTDKTHNAALALRCRLLREASRESGSWPPCRVTSYRRSRGPGPATWSAELRFW